MSPVIEMKLVSVHMVTFMQGDLGQTSEMDKGNRAIDFQPAFRDEKFEKVVTRPFRREI